MAQKISIIQLEHAAGLPLPSYETALAAGADLRAALPDGPVVIQTMDRLAIPTGLALSMPEHLEAQIRPRSGLALRYGLTLANAPGTIDADYRGEIKVLLVNLGRDEVVIEHGMRIAQMVFAPIIKVLFNKVSQLDITDRGAGGFGSTGQ